MTKQIIKNNKYLWILNIFLLLHLQLANVLKLPNPNNLGDCRSINHHLQQLQ